MFIYIFFPNHAQQVNLSFSKKSGQNKSEHKVVITRGVSFLLEFEPPQRSVLWHLQIVVDDDNSKLERAIQHLRDEAAAAQAGGVGVMLDLRLEQLESQVPVVRPSQSAPASSESSLSSADIERRWRDIEGRESFP